MRIMAMRRLTFKQLKEFSDRRIRKRKNLNAVAVGEPGNGKTYGMIYLGTYLDRHFNHFRFVMDNNYFYLCYYWKKPRPGDAFLLDDLELWKNKRDFGTDEGKLFNKVIKTYRKKRTINLITCPAYVDLVLSLRQEVHLLLDFIKQGIAIVYKLKRNTFTGKIKRTLMGYLEFPLPRENLIFEYEKLNFKDDIIIKELIKNQEKNDKNKQELSKFEIDPISLLRCYENCTYENMSDLLRVKKTKIYSLIRTARIRRENAQIVKAEKMQEKIKV